MNRKGFTLVELLGSLLLMFTILCIGLYSARDTLATTMTTLNKLGENEIYNATRSYVLENSVTWINQDEEYTCVKVSELVDYGYFDDDEVSDYKNSIIKVVRDSKTKVINDIKIDNSCSN